MNLIFPNVLKCLFRPAEPHDTVKLTFALKQQNLDQLEKVFWDVSNPESSVYGIHLSLEQVVDIVKPSFTSMKVRFTSS